MLLVGGGIMGASPGASTAPSIMLDLLQKVFPGHLATPAWQERIRAIVPTYGIRLNQRPDLLARHWAQTGEGLRLAIPSPAVAPVAPQAPAATRVNPDRHPELVL